MSNFKTIDRWFHVVSDAEQRAAGDKDRLLTELRSLLLLEMTERDNLRTQLQTAQASLLDATLRSDSSAAHG